MKLPTKVIKALSINQDQCFDADDIASRFDVHRAKVITELAEAVKQGDLRFDAEGAEDGGPIWYLPGSAFAKKHEKPVNVAALQAVDLQPKLGFSVPKSVIDQDAGFAHRPFGKERRSYTHRDFSAAVIEDGIPLPPQQRATSQRDQVLQLLQRMKPSQSFSSTTAMP